MKTNFPSGFAKVLPQATLLLALGMLGSGIARAQEVSPVTLRNVPPDLIQAEGAQGTEPAQAQSAAAPSDVDLGQNFAADAAAPAVRTAPRALGVASRAAAGADRQSRRTRRPPPTAAQLRAGVERAVFDRAPVPVPLPVNVERLITLPAPAALHVPADMAQVARIEVIDRTIYATALKPFTTIRIVAELIDSGQQIPMDLVANDNTSSARAELEVFTVETGLPGKAGASTTVATTTVGGDSGIEPEKPAPTVDMVELTRHAARQLYAPRRLAWATPGVQQVEVDTRPVPGLMRGELVETVPLGQWRAGQLHVTAVRVTNRSRHAIELPLDQMRGRWISVTAQHGRIGPAGSEDDTTAIYMVCDRSFATCIN